MPPPPADQGGMSKEEIEDLRADVCREIFDCDPGCYSHHETKGSMRRLLATIDSLRARALALEGVALVGHGEFDARMATMAEALPVVKALLPMGFSKWTKRLQDDFYLKAGLEPVLMYRVVAEVDLHRKKPALSALDGGK